MISTFVELTWLLYEPELDECDGLEATGFPKLIEGVLWLVVGFPGMKWLTILENDIFSLYEFNLKWIFKLFFNCFILFKLFCGTYWCPCVIIEWSIDGNPCVKPWTAWTIILGTSDKSKNPSRLFRDRCLSFGWKFEIVLVLILLKLLTRGDTSNSTFSTSLLFLLNEVLICEYSSITPPPLSSKTLLFLRNKWKKKDF